MEKRPSGAKALMIPLALFRRLKPPAPSGKESNRLQEVTLGPVLFWSQ